MSATIRLVCSGSPCGQHLEIILALSECSYLVPDAADLEILESTGIFDFKLFGVRYVEKIEPEHLASREVLHRVCPRRDTLAWR